MESFACPFVSNNICLAFHSVQSAICFKLSVICFLCEVWVEECGVDWPLVLSKPGTLERVYQEYTRFLTLLDTRHGLLECNVSDGCLTAAQAEDIASKQLNGERNRLVIAIMLRKSIGCFHKSIMCLIKSKQSHVARLIVGEEGN
jgi:hypothetical protein